VCVSLRTVTQRAQERSCALTHAFLVMLIANGMRHVPASTIALEVRGFGMHQTRTFFRTYRVDRRGPAFGCPGSRHGAVPCHSGTPLMKSFQLRCSVPSP